MSERIMEKWDKTAIPINKISDSKFPREKGRLPSLGILTGTLGGGGGGGGDAEEEEEGTRGGSTTRRDRHATHRGVEIDVMAEDEMERDVTAMTEALMAQVDEQMRRKQRKADSGDTL